MVDPSFRVTPMDGGTLQLAGELDMASAPLLSAALEGLPVEGRLSFDLAELTFLDSSGLNAFSQYASSLNGQGPLILANVRSPLTVVTV